MLITVRSYVMSVTNGRIPFQSAPSTSSCVRWASLAIPQQTHPDAACVWGWNGDMEHPTLTPSLNCVAEKDGKPTSGCGWHGFITNGEFQ
jgi:hypothetical protein